MTGSLNRDVGGDLVRSCGPGPRDWIRAAPADLEPDGRGIERIEACFAGHAYDPHRHDTYAIGLTTAGVQSFGYRGTTEHSLAGQAIVLHPDERHDGHAGSPAGFRYRMMYVEPRLIQAALGGAARALPFAPAVSGDRRLVAAIRPALEDLEAPLEPLERDQCLAALARALAAVDDEAPRRALGPVAAEAVELAREHIAESFAETVRSETLEALTGLDRYTLARHFRARFGTSPYRYLTMRRLDRARRLIGRGAPLAEAALASGFADQSHMTRRFKQAYGLSPGRWRAMQAAPASR